jgi:hypothetical protein
MSDEPSPGSYDATEEVLARAAKLKAEKEARRGRANGATGDQTSLGEWDAGDDTGVPSPRAWLLGTIFCRKFASSLIGEGAVGKTALRYLQLISAATFRDLSGDHVFQRCRVLIVSLEDSADELRRRILAVALHHGVDRAELRGWLFLAAPGRNVGKLATVNERGRVVVSAMAGAIEAAIIRHKIDIVSLDPFKKAHGVEENDNTAIDEVMQILIDLGDKYDIAVDTTHHTPKGPPDPGNPARGRGAGSKKDAERLVYTATGMSEEEAKLFGLTEAERRHLIRLDSAKVNIAPPLTEAKWFRLVGVRIGNETALYPHGDEVQTVEPWTPPSTWAGLSHHLLNQILNDIDTDLPDGNRYTSTPSATDRAAWKIVLTHAPDKSEAQAREIVRTWVETGVLVVYEYENPVTRKPVKGLRVDPSKRPT